MHINKYNPYQNFKSKSELSETYIRYNCSDECIEYLHQRLIDSKVCVRLQCCYFSVLRSAVVIFRKDGTLTCCHRPVALSESCLEGGCLFCLCGHQEAAANLSQTRIFHILTLNGVLGIVPQLAISAITGYCFRIHSRFSSCLKLKFEVEDFVAV